MLNTAMTNGSGTVDYHWLNRGQNKTERKTAFFQKVGERIIAVGYYIPQASPEEAKALLKKAASFTRNSPQKAFAAFNTLNGDYVQDDLYVFVVGLDDGIFRAHGVTPALVGSDGKLLLDTNGKPIIQEMIPVAKTKRYGEIDYLWLNPVTVEVEEKHTYFERVDNFLVAVGFYTR